MKAWLLMKKAGRRGRRSLRQNAQYGMSLEEVRGVYAEAVSVAGAAAAVRRLAIGDFPRWCYQCAGEKLFETKRTAYPAR